MNDESESEKLFPIYHHHQLTETDRPSFCNICSSRISTTESHYCCWDCDFDLCNECLKNHQNELFTGIKDIIEKPLNHRMGNNENKNVQKKPSLNQQFVQHAISSSRPKFYLFEEQKEWPNNDDYQIEATSKFDDNVGRKLLYFTSNQANKMMGKCNKSIEKFVNDHRKRFAILKNIFKNNENYLFLQEYDCGFDIPRIPVIGSIASFISQIMGKYGLHDILAKAKNADIFKNKLQAASQTVGSQNKLGCIIFMKNESQIINIEHIYLISLVPDLLPIFNWSNNLQTDLMPKISSLIELFNEKYVDLYMKKKYYEKNLICGATDFLEEGLLAIKHNRKLSEEDCHSIQSLLENLGKLQISIRIKPIELTILQTTIPNIYQTGEKEKKIFHAFLTFEQLTSIHENLVNDIVTSLKNLSDCKDIDIKNQENSIQNINVFIQESEVNLINFFEENTNAISKYAYEAFSLMLKSKLESVEQFLYNRAIDGIYNNQNDSISEDSQNDYSNEDTQNNTQISQINEDNQNNQIVENSQITRNTIDTQQLTLNQISRFNKDLINIFNQIVKKLLIKDSFIDFCNESVGKLMKEIAERKHLKEILKLTYEIDRMKDQINNKSSTDNMYSIDLMIEKNDDSIQKYRIQKIVNH